MNPLSCQLLISYWLEKTDRVELEAEKKQTALYSFHVDFLENKSGFTDGDIQKQQSLCLDPCEACFWSISHIQIMNAPNVKSHNVLNDVEKIGSTHHRFWNYIDSQSESITSTKKAKGRTNKELLLVSFFFLF